MSNLIDTFANRLSEALVLRNIKPSQLAERTGIDKSKISSYMSGRFKAKQDGIHIISKYLDVDPAWLMGYDVPMERAYDPLQDAKELIKTCYGHLVIDLLDSYSKLNELGKETATQRVDELTEMPKYTEKVEKKETNQANG